MQNLKKVKIKEYDYTSVNTKSYLIRLSKNVCWKLIKNKLSKIKRLQLNKETAFKYQSYLLAKMTSII